MKKIIPVFILFSVLLLLSSCSMTLPVRGQMTSGAKTFTGTATGYMGGGGDLSITLNDGTTCTGNFVYINPRQGEGVFTCSNNKSGPFAFVSTGTSGTGTGVIGGEYFTFTFGN